MKIIEVNGMNFYVIAEDNKTMTLLAVETFGDMPYKEANEKAAEVCKSVNKAVSSRLLTIEEAKKLPLEVRKANNEYWLEESKKQQFRHCTRRGEVLDNSDFRYYIGVRPVVILNK